MNIISKRTTACISAILEKLSNLNDRQHEFKFYQKIYILEMVTQINAISLILAFKRRAVNKIFFKRCTYI